MPVQARDRTTWRVFGVLMAGALVGVVGILPYVLTLLDGMPSSVRDMLPSRWMLIPLQVVQTMVLIGAATALGLWLGPKVGLGAPLLYGLVRGDWEARSRLRALILPSAVWGVLVGVGVSVGGIGVLVGILVGVCVAVGAGVMVAVGVLVRTSVGLGVLVGVCVFVAGNPL